MHDRKYTLNAYWQSKFTFTLEDLVDIFLNIHRNWFEEKENGFYGKREQCRHSLLNEKIDRWPGESNLIDAGLVYLHNKFNEEFLGDMFQEKEFK